MKKSWLKALTLVLAAALILPVSVMAQEDKEKLKEKIEKEKKDGQQIIITRKNTEEKMVIEINGDKVTVNGKPIDEYREKNGDLNVRLNKLKDMEYLTRIPNVSGSWNMNSDNHQGMLFNEDNNRAMLGVTTDKTDEGVTILSITKEGAAEKMGLKEGDVITKFDNKAIKSPDELTSAVKSRKPGDKVSVTYLRDKKENSTSGELGKWKTQNFKMDMGDMNWDNVMPKIQTYPRAQTFTYTGKTPKLGLSVQDTDDGKGVKVIEVDGDSNAAKAGIKENDVVTEIDGKAVNSTDDVVKSMKDNKDKVSVMFKVTRSGKTQNVEVKMPRAIKTKDL